MPTTNWEVRNQSPHYLFYSLERFRMVQKLRKLRFLLLLLILDMVEEDSGGSLTILCMALRMMSIQDHLHALRPYNFYPSVGFYPTGTHDPYWTRSARHEELFLKRFRFRLPDFHRLMRAMKMDGEYFTCDTGKKYPADLCMMVLFRRLSYPCTFWQLATEFGIPSHRLCEIFHTTLEHIFDRFHALIEFETWTPFFEQFAQMATRRLAPARSMWCTFYGNQFTHQLGHALHMEIVDLLSSVLPLLNERFLCCAERHSPARWPAQSIGERSGFAARSIDSAFVRIY